MSQEFSPENNPSEQGLRDYIAVISKRRWTVLLVFFAVVVSTAIFTITATPVYRATTRVLIEKENPNIVSVQDVMALDASGTDYYQTQYKIITSYRVAQEVVRRLDLENNPEFLPDDDSGTWSSLLKPLKDAAAWVKDSVTGLIRGPDAVDTARGEIDGRSEAVSPIVQAALGRVEVEPIRNSRLVDISFEAENPRLAARAANTFSEVYIEQNLDMKLSAVKDAVKWLQERIDEERRKVEIAENALLEYKEEYGIVTDFSSDVEKVTAQKLAQLNTQVVDAESRRVEAETRYMQARALAGTPDLLDTIPEVLSSELIAQIKKMEVDLYKRMSELSKKYGRNHPQMVALDSELETLEKRKNNEIRRVISSLENQYRVALAKEKSLKDALDRQKAESLELNQKAVRYGVLRREAESARNMYELLIQRFKETTLTEDMKTGNIRIMDTAKVPLNYVKPKTKLNLLLALVVGLTLGVGLAFFLEYLDNTIRGPDQVETYLKSPFLGPVPMFKVSTNGRDAASFSSELVTYHDPKGVSSESYRGVRSSVLLSRASSSPRVILVTSAAPKEGKSLTTANLAITMAQAGGSVCVVDCDMRKPSMHKLFNLPRERGGLSNILAEGTDWRDVVHSTAVDGLDVIISGPVPPNPSELLGSEPMHRLLNSLKDAYQYVLIDSPPVSAVTDPVVLAGLSDGVAVVVRSGWVPRGAIQASIEKLLAVETRLLGVILNGMESGGKDGYYHGYYYYHYYYGEEGERKRSKRRSKSKK